MSRLSTLVCFGFAAAPFGLLAFQQPSPPTAAQKEQALQVVTLLKGRCSSCHGPQNAKAKLDLTTAEGLIKGGRSGPLFTAGNATGSLLLERLEGGGDMDQMPLGFAPFTADEIQMVRDWINAGALVTVSNKDHWAYTAPVMPPVPVVKHSAWVRNPIDNFVAARLEQAHLAPSKEARRETLLRRVTLDLTGLPPTLAEMDAFLADTRPDAYERVVDRLLASPHYGERQARPWLDLARYADSDGYEKDLNRTAYLWRDWVIDAYNRNMPFDAFTIEQIAGDQLPNPTRDELIATGFHRNSMLNLEGGVDQAEAHFNVVLDRVNTTSTVWLGSTLACARCHDHKYDPFSQKDYYRMAAFFNNAVINPKGPKEVGEEKWFETFMPAPSAEQARRQTALKSLVAEANRKLATWNPSQEQQYQAWAHRLDDKVTWAPFAPSQLLATNGTELAQRTDGYVWASGANPSRSTYTLKGGSPVGSIAGLRLDAQPTPGEHNGGPGRADNGNFVIGSINVLVNGKPVRLSQAAADFEQNGFPARNILSGGANDGWAVDPKTGGAHTLVVDFVESVPVGPGDAVTVIIAQETSYDRHTLGRFSLSLTGDPMATLSFAPDRIKAITANTNRSPTEEQELRAYFADHSTTFADLRARRDDAQRELAQIQRDIPTALVMKDKPTSKPLTEYVRTRGEYLSKGELVSAAVPGVLPQLPEGKARRLELAKWLVDRKNPLTARVQMNRLWEQVFGRGIVETTEDFGTQSARPTHPELLDFLAVRFMDSGWDLKAMHKLIVMSATYRQSSESSAALNEADPNNLLLARGPRFRMEAEMIRDVGLAASGLLNDKIGGASVFPYQPPNTWNNGISGQDWTPSTGADRYRRSLYTFWKRTAAYPVFMAFDATSREECTVRRIRTNTPLQALAQLNDPGGFDAAKALGKRMADAPPGSGIKLGFRLCTSRMPTAFEAKRLQTLMDRLRDQYRAHPSEAKEIAPTADLAAWTMVANTLLNLDEAVTKA